MFCRPATLYFCVQEQVFFVGFRVHHFDSEFSFWRVHFVLRSMMLDCMSPIRLDEKNLGVSRKSSTESATGRASDQAGEANHQLQSSCQRSKGGRRLADQEPRPRKKSRECRDVTANILSTSPPPVTVVHARSPPPSFLHSLVQSITTDSSTSDGRSCVAVDEEANALVLW